MDFKRALLAGLLGLGLPALAAATYVQQSGTVTYPHLAYWATQGVIGDAGNAWLTREFDSQFGSTPGMLVCRSATKWVALAPGAAGQFLEAQTNACPLWATPGSTFNNPIRTVASGTTDTATSVDGTITWNSATTGAKTQTLYACAAGVTGRVLNIKDEKGTAGTYNIALTPSAGTIEGGSTYAMAFPYQAVTLQCDGSTTNWVVL